MNISDILGLSYLQQTLSPYFFGSEETPSPLTSSTGLAAIPSPIDPTASPLRKTSTPSFEIREIRTLQDRSETIKTVRSWTTLSIKMETPPPEESRKFTDSRSTTRGIELKLNHLNRNDRVFVCIDDQNRPQSVSVVSDQEDDLYVNLLATHPNNISSSVELEPGPQIKGSGTAMMNHLFKTCVEENKSKVALSPMPSSWGFYKKLGLTLSQETADMFITSAKITSLPKFSKVKPTAKQHALPRITPTSQDLKTLDYLDLAHPSKKT